MAAFERWVQDERTVSWSRSAKGVLLLSSSLLFVLSLGLIFHWRTVLMLFAILFLHELGHWCGMRLCGYREAQILFLPFLGGATLGYKDVATPGQKLLVHFLGPVPGLMLGFAAVALPASGGLEPWATAERLAIVINYFNLLPCAPLDGGNIINILFLKRWPRSGLVLLFVAVSCSGLELWWHGQSLLILATVPFGLTVLAQRRWRDAAARLARVLPLRADTAACLEAICQTLAHPQFRRQATEKWCQLAGDLLSCCTTPPLPLRTILISCLLYGVLLFVPIHLAIM
jgi:Zn-dependent protease